MTNDEIELKTLLAILHNQALLLTILENQAVLFDRSGIEPLELAIEGFQERRWKTVENLAGQVFGSDTKTRLMLRRMGIEPPSPHDSEDG